jgi:peptide/nickel transport system permease protein
MQQLRQVWNIFRHKPMGMAGLILLCVVLFVAIFAPILAPYNPYDWIEDIQPEDLLTPPDSEYLLGRDDVGKDVLSQLLYGARVSLTVGFASAIMSILLGTSIGLVAGYYGGKISDVLMRFTDFLLVIPNLPLMLVIISVFGRGLLKIILVIGLLGWTYVARLVRSQVISIKERQFVTRARSIGASDFRIMVNHILPQVVPVIVAESVLTISDSIISESTLSFLGLGDPTRVSWGMMLNFAFERGLTPLAWWFLLPPGFAIVFVSLGLILIGSVIEEIVNPRLKTHHLFDARKMVARAIGIGIPETFFEEKSEQ